MPVSPWSQLVPPTSEVKVALSFIFNGIGLAWIVQLFAGAARAGGVFWMLYIVYSMREKRSNFRKRIRMIIKCNSADD